MNPREVNAATASVKWSGKSPSFGRSESSTFSTSLSFNSTIIRFAILGPIPGIVFNEATSPVIILLLNSSGLAPEIIPIANFGPIFDIVINILNSSNSLSPEKP